MGQHILNRKVVVVVIAVAVGLLHFVTGPNYRGPFPVFVNGYMIDVLLPFAMVLVLGISEPAILRNVIGWCIFVFGVGVTVETLQYFGVPLFGRTFDWIDFIMYALGVGLAILFEKFVLEKIPFEKTG